MGLMGWLTKSKNDESLGDAEARAAVENLPGPRGWTDRAGGRARVSIPREFEAPSNQVCGLWPFSAGSGVPVVGVPLGRHLETAATVCADPISWFVNKLILNPSAFILGRPGLGKSTLVRRICSVLPAWGVLPIVLSDTKGEHGDMILTLDGFIIRLGRGVGGINPLDPGPLAEHLHELPAHLAKEMEDDLLGRRRNVLGGLIELVTGRRLEAHETSIISAGLRVLDEEHEGIPVVDDLRRLIETKHPAIKSAVRDRDDEDRWAERTETVLDGLYALSRDGQFGSIFAEQTTTPIDLNRPVCFDLSSVEDGDELLLAALQLVSWSYGSAAVHAATVLARAGLRPQRIYVLVMDELWRVLQASKHMVPRIDALTRLNRQRGLGQIMITHTMADLEIDGEGGPLTKTAWGFVERSGMLFLGGLASGEMGNLRRVYGLAAREAQQLIEWSAEDSDSAWADSADPPGMGRFLLKTGKKPGVPFKVELTDTERNTDINNTNRRWTDQMKDRRAA